MSAAGCIGRVGGLVVVLGMFAGHGLAWADTSKSGTAAVGATTGSHPPGSRSGGLSTSKHGKAPVPPAVVPRTWRADIATPGIVHRNPRPWPSVAGLTDAGQRRAQWSPPTVPLSLAVTGPEAVTQRRRPSPAVPGLIRAAVTATLPTPVAGPAPSTPTMSLAAVVSGLLGGFPNGGDLPTAPVQPATMWTLLAFVRRELSPEPITVASFVGFSNGIIAGGSGALDRRGLPLSFTVVSAPSGGGKVTLDKATGDFTFLPYATVVSAGGAEQFSVLVSETTAFDAALEKIPVAGTLVSPILAEVHRVPILNTVLGPLIGYALIEPITVDVGALVPAGAPVAFTVKVISFDGTPISTNFFPASGLQQAQKAPTILWSPGFGGPGVTDPNSQWDPFAGIAPLRENGYNVVTWDPRGEHASGGTLEFDSPQYEARDVSALIDWVAEQPEALLDGPNDPRIGMVGGSYGGGIQLVSAAIDPRIDAIVPAITWNSLNTSFYPNQAFKTAVALLLLLTLADGSRLDPQIYYGILTGALTGRLTPAQQALLAARAPEVSNITAPTLLIQGTVDDFFGLQQADTNSQILAADGVPVKMVWFCGGHGTCLSTTDNGSVVEQDTLAWLDRYVKDDPLAPTFPTFEWVDQTGQYYSSELLPSNPSFHGAPIVVSGGGGILPIVPLLGGSGPQKLATFPYSLIEPSKAKIALNVPIPTESAQIVGAPQLTLTYAGVGPCRHIYAQLVDDDTGLVVGNQVTAIPVTLDGKTHTVSVPLDEVAYTMTPGDKLSLQLVGSATLFESLTSVAVIDVSSAQLTLPTVGPGADAMAEPSSAGQLATVA
ncbi:MAG TPA: CocE/NonD family hydrolase [Mycobacterium sp.]|nr:CocE/NonD family hydrolase [Mycobacterium sp.]